MKSLPMKRNCLKGQVTLMRAEFHRILVPYEKSFGRRRHRTWYREVLSTYAVQEVLKVFTKILHTLESDKDLDAVATRALQAVTTPETRRAVEDGAARIRTGRGTPTPIILFAIQPNYNLTGGLP